jgi:hypothetical protein
VSGTPRVRIVSVSAAPHTVVASGGTTSVMAKIRHGVVCQLRLLSHEAFPVVYPHAERGCTRGDFSARITVEANPSSVARTVVFEVLARNSWAATSQKFGVVIIGAVAARVVSVSSTPTWLPGRGGVVTVAAKVRDASSCRLSLLSRQSFDVGFFRGSTRCTSRFSTRGGSCPSGTVTGKIVKQTQPDSNGDYSVTVRITNGTSVAISVLSWGLSQDLAVFSPDSWLDSSPTIPPGGSINDTEQGSFGLDPLPPPSQDQVSVSWGFASSQYSACRAPA